MNTSTKFPSTPKGLSPELRTPNTASEKPPASEIQAFNTIVRLPIALDVKTCAESVNSLNQVLADTMTLRDLYKKHHWQVSGPTFQQLHGLFDKHWSEQSALVDIVAERIQTLGGVTLAMAPDIADTTLIPRPPRGREGVRAQVSRLLHAHEIILVEARSMARLATASGDEGTADILISNVIRTNELQGWFVSQHMVADSMPASDSTNTESTSAISVAPLTSVLPPIRG